MLGNLAGSWIAYAVGYYGRLDLLEKNKLIHISPKHLKWADDWFERYGSATVFFSRMLPIVRTFISLPAGVAKMPFWRFTTYTLLGSIPWVLALALIGKAVGENWEEWREHLHYLDYVVLAVIVVWVVYLADQRRAARAEARAGRRAGRLERSLTRGADGRIPAGRALALGVVQGPAELLPVSSSAHIVLVPWLAGWDWDGSTRRSARASRSPSMPAPRRRC